MSSLSGKQGPRYRHVTDDTEEPVMRVAAIHDDIGYRRVRSALSRQYDLARRERVQVGVAI